MNKAFEEIISQIVELVNYNGNAYLDSADVIEIVQEVTEEYKDGWIACSERLPEVGQIVLANVIKPSKYVNKGTPIIITEYEDVYYWRNGTILAWQPLPEPFKESDNR